MNTALSLSFGFGGTNAVLAWRGATTASDIQTELHPVRSWFWRGIPADPGLAMVLGEPYATLWVLRGSIGEGGLVFVDEEDWGTLRPLRLQVPPTLVQPWTSRWVEHPGSGHTMNWSDARAATFPF